MKQSFAIALVFSVASLWTLPFQAFAATAPGDEGKEVVQPIADDAEEPDSKAYEPAADVQDTTAELPEPEVKPLAPIARPAKTEPAPTATEKTDAVEQQSFKKVTITGTTGDKDGFKDIAASIAGLGKDVDQLKANVQKTRQGILQDSKTNNFVEMEARLQADELASLKSLEIKLDGYSVYDIDDTAGLWMPTRRMPVYSGPLQPGSHRVDVTARLVMRQDAKLALDGDAYRIINKSFDIKVPDGKYKKRWVINIKPPTGKNSKADAEISQPETNPEVPTAAEPVKVDERTDAAKNQ